MLRLCHQALRDWLGNAVLLLRLQGTNVERRGPPDGESLQGIPISWQIYRAHLILWNSARKQESACQAECSRGKPQMTDSAKLNFL